MGIKDQNILFSILGKATYYTPQTRPSFWHNEHPFLSRMHTLSDMQLLPLQLFPLIEDFEVILERMEVIPENGKDVRKSPFGYHVYFFSPSRGYIAGFPWWDHAERDIRREDFTVPLGDFNQPYVDLEQGWQIVIAKHDAFIYVLEGDFDRITTEGYHTWFKVPEQVYLNQWESAIQACRQLSDV